MPWSNQSGGGGPWGGGGGSGGNGGGRGPWGGGPSGSQPPDLEELLRRSQDRLKNVLPGGEGIGPRGIAFIVVGLLIAWALTGWYRVQPDELGVNIVFGKFTSVTRPGLNYNYPYPIGSVVKPKVTTVNSFDVGARAERRDNDESLMLTGDENIVDINFNVQWQINPNAPQDFVFNLRESRRHCARGRRKRHARSDRPPRHPADPDRRPFRDRDPGPGADAEGARRLQGGRSRQPRPAPEGGSAAAGDRLLPRCAGRPRRLPAPPERGADLRKPRRAGGARRILAHHPVGGSLSRQDRRRGGRPGLAVHASVR